MRIRLTFDSGDVAPCLCRIKPILTAFPGALLEIDPAGIGSGWAERLRRVGVEVTIMTPTEDVHAESTDQSPR